MHSEWDTQTVTKTLAVWGVRHHAPAYYAVRGTLRFLTRVAIVLAVIILPHSIAYTLIP